jgi:hypothetical protein
LEYLKVVKFGTPFLCIQCKAELQIAKSESIFRTYLTFAASIVVGFMVGLRGWSLGIGTVLLFFPIGLLTSLVLDHTYPPKLELSNSTLRLR